MCWQSGHCKNKLYAMNFTQHGPWIYSHLEEKQLNIEPLKHISPFNLMCILQYRVLFASATFYTKYCVIVENHCNGVKCCFLCVCIHSRGEGNGIPLQYPCLENPMDRGVWWAAVHGVAKSQTRLSNFTFTFHFHALEKEMATHSIVPAWRIPRMGEPGGLPSMGSHRVGHG